MARPLRRGALNGLQLPLVEPHPVSEGLSLALVGDISLPRLGAGLPSAAEALGGPHDAVFGNLEMLLAEPQTSSFSPSAHNDGTWLFGELSVAYELRSLGVSAVSLANNHALDFGGDALLSTTEELRRAGVRPAGAGRNLSVARLPVWLSTPRGTVALIAATLSGDPASRALDAEGMFASRPGVQLIRSIHHVRLPAQDWRNLASAITGVSIDAHKLNSSVQLGGVSFEYDPSLEPGTHERTITLDPVDVSSLLSSVRHAAQGAGLVVVSVHAHAPSNLSEHPDSSQRVLASQLVNEGADVVVMHGPHRLRGVEMVEGKPVLYSLGSFAYASQLLTAQPREYYDRAHVTPDQITLPELASALAHSNFDAREYSQTAVATINVKENRRASLHLLPVTTSSGPNCEAGMPALAIGSDRDEIVAQLERLSAYFGTRFERDSRGLSLVFDL